MYDPAQPANNSALSSQVMRSQLTGLKALIDAIPTGPQGPQGDTGAQGPPFASAVVDSVATLPPNSSAAVDVTFDGVTVHFTFSIPQGAEGAQGIQGYEGAQGPPGEVTLSQLDNAIAGVLNVSSNISNAVNTLNQPADSSYNQTQMQDVLSKLDELIQALRR